MRRRRSHTKSVPATEQAGCRRSGQSRPASVASQARSAAKSPPAGRCARRLVVRRKAPASGKGSNTLTLYQNLPNPFSEETIISFLVPRGRTWRMRIEDAGGQVIRCFDGNRGGTITLAWNGSDDAGVSVPTGTYYCRLESDKSADRRKMTLIR